MRSIITVTTPATTERLTTVARVQQDLGITGSDTEIETAIDEASSRIEAELGYRLPLETVTETFRPLNGYDYASAILLERTPVVSIDSITQDAAALVSDEWEVDPVNGLLLWLDGSGMATPWKFYSGLAVSYSGGWVLPGDPGRTLPYAIEGAAVAYVRTMWFARGNNPLVKSVDIPGVVSYEYGTGGITFAAQVGALPSDVLAMLQPFKRMRV
jgi:hypothetical protein